ncbi:hypothetical protein Ahy_B01g056919 isoform B [Arachis hypogaea]|uniref:1-phosphatidylinositol-4-phosphate 5-kinase n=1 Tax=Arachis hypogaea TaxID=3818 RepID=A0A445AZZ8_ARAHY|nr:hypothetical protein Ahy_B01g056919 isoform B [Arachis hypogaea]
MKSPRKNRSQSFSVLTFTLMFHLLFRLSNPSLCLIDLTIRKLKPQSRNSSSSPPSQALTGIWNDLEEISGSFKNFLSLLSSNRTVTGISKLASQLLQLKPDHKRQGDVDGDGDVVPGMMEEAVRFIKEISMRPDCWTEFPLPFHHVDYMLSICENEALRELCSPKKSGSFFYLTNDDRYMIKTMKKAEVKV